MSLLVPSQYTRPWRLSFFFPFGCTCRSRRRQNTVSTVACCHARTRPLPVSAMLQANLFYTLFYRTVTSCLASCVFRRDYSRGRCHGHARSCFQSALSQPDFTGANFCTPRRSRRSGCLAACWPPPLVSLPHLALHCLVRHGVLLCLVRRDTLLSSRPVLNGASRLRLLSFDAISGRSF